MSGVLVMSPSKIEVGKTYCNRGKGRTTRTVLEISDNLKAAWFSNGDRPHEPVVRYIQNGVHLRRGAGEKFRLLNATVLLWRTNKLTIERKHE